MSFPILTITLSPSPRSFKDGEILPIPRYYLYICRSRSSLPPSQPPEAVNCNRNWDFSPSSLGANGVMSEPEGTC